MRRQRLFGNACRRSGVGIKLPPETVFNISLAVNRFCCSLIHSTHKFIFDKAPKLNSFPYVNMAAEPEILLSYIVRIIETKFQRQYLCFRGRPIQFSQCRRPSTTTNMELQDGDRQTESNCISRSRLDKTGFEQL